MPALDPDPREVRYYENADGECPMKVWRDSLRKADQARVGRAIGLLQQFGKNLRPPYVEHLEGHIYASRFPIQDGDLQVRLLFFFDGPRRIVITHPIYHRSRGTGKHHPIEPAEITRAEQRRLDYYARHQDQEDP